MGLDAELSVEVAGKENLFAITVLLFNKYHDYIFYQYVLVLISLIKIIETIIIIVHILSLSSSFRIIDSSIFFNITIIMTNALSF